MRKFEYKKVRPLFDRFRDVIIDHIPVHSKEDIFDTITISESEWLNLNGQEGWELIHIDRVNSHSGIGDYYFKREVLQ